MSRDASGDWAPVGVAEPALTAIVGLISPALLRTLDLEKGVEGDELVGDGGDELIEDLVGHAALLYLGDRLGEPDRPSGQVLAVAHKGENVLGPGAESFLICRLDC